MDRPANSELTSQVVESEAFSSDRKPRVVLDNGAEDWQIKLRIEMWEYCPRVSGILTVALGHVGLRLSRLTSIRRI